MRWRFEINFPRGAKLIKSKDAENAEEAFFLVDADDEAVDVLLPCLRLTLRLVFLFFGTLLSVIKLQHFVEFVYSRVVYLFVLVLFIILVLCLLSWSFHRFEPKSVTPITRQPLGIRN